MEDEKKQIEKETKKLETTIKDGIANVRQRREEALDAMKTGKGILHLEKPILSDDIMVKELKYDFMALTGMEYADAMDSDSQTQQLFRITNRQALALFAAAAAKQTEHVDQTDIMQRIGVTDAVEGTRLAVLFFQSSVRAGEMRIYKNA